MVNVEKKACQDPCRAKDDFMFGDMLSGFDLYQISHLYTTRFRGRYNRGMCWLWWYAKLAQFQQKFSIPTYLSRYRNNWKNDYDWFFNIESFIDKWDWNRDSGDREFEDVAKFFMLIEYFSCIDQISFHRGIREF